MRLLAALVVCLAGCGTTTKNYPTDRAGNVALRADLDRGVKAVVHVHAVDARCATQYQGTLFIEGPATSISLPPGRPSYVAVTFDTSSFLRGSASTTAGSVITPRPGRKYEIVVSYRAQLYELRMREDGREIARQDLGACRPA